MTGSRSPAFTPWLATLILAAATVGLLASASLVMFSAFMFYDDEGYVLISLRNFAEHGKLYSEVYTQYGPFPFVFYSGLHALGMPFTHTAGRVVTLLAWSGTALFCASIARHASRSLALQLAVLASVFVYLWVMASEPTHPGGLIAVITAGLAALGYRWILADRTRALALGIGAVAAVLLLTKINVGIFAALAGFAWWLLHHRHDTIRRVAPGVIAVAGVLLPLALMRLLLGVPWVQTFALVFACSALTAALAGSLNRTARIGWSELGWAALSAAVVGLIVLGVIFARGTTVHDFFEGVLFRPMRQPVNFSLRFLWPVGIRGVAIASTLLCGVAWLLRRRGVSAVDPVVAGLRLAVAAGMAVTIARFDAISPDNLVFGCAMPCLWIFLWPLAGENSAVTAARQWLALLLLGQCLHVFPVPGSQIAWSTLLALPLIAVGAWEAAAWLGQRFPAENAPHRQRGIVALRLAVAGFALWAGSRLAKVGSRYREGSDLGLPGAEMLRLPDPSVARFRLFTLNASAHGDMLFSLPGMFSFNLWSGLPTPTLSNVTHWFSLLDETQQQAIVRSLEAHPRACVIVQREHVDFLKKHGLAPAGLLYDYVAQNFVPAFTLDDFEFCVRRDRKVEPLMFAQAFILPTTEEENTVFKLTLLLAPGQRVASFEIGTNDPAAAPLILNATNARVEMTPVNLRGEPIGPTEKPAWPFTANAPAVVSLYFHREGRPKPVRGAVVILRDSTGAEIALARLSQ